jgi:AcrR family transcriptional regulator
MPRSYRLGRRAETQAETRARIVAAATVIYRDQGMAAASNLAIARAADVAPATVRNHFPDPGDLAAAVLEGVIAGLRPPSAEIFAGAVGIRERVARLGDALVEFNVRSEPWWEVFTREPALTEAWAGGAEWYSRHVDGLYRQAIEPLGSDDTAVAVVTAVVGTPFYYALRGQGFPPEQAMDIGVELAVPWLEARAAALGDRPQGR